MNNHHVELRDNDRPAKQGAVRVRDIAPDARVQVTITLRGPRLREPRAGQPAMDRSQFAEAFGASQADADKVRHVLEGYGLTVDDVSLMTRSMSVSGNAEAIEAAFSPQLGIYRSAEQGEYRGREGTIKIPRELDGLVTGVFGLDERRVARRAIGRSAAAASATASSGLRPADFESRYNFPAGDGAGQQIVIAEFGGGYFQADLEAYCLREGRPVPTVTTVPLGLPALTLDQIRALPKKQRLSELGMSIEVMMDVEIIAGLCPSAELFVYFAHFSQRGWVDLLDAVIAGTPATPTIVSISWGLPEDYPDWSPAAVTAINERLQAAAALGVTVCVASGDDGSGDQLADGRSHVNYPASSQHVLSVGGTMLTGTAPSKEVVWWDAPGERTPNGGGSTGGGVSVLFDRPAWQDVTVASLNPGSIDGRVVPDVAALAGEPLYDLIFLGQVMPNGGTSASAPLWAALLARIAARLPEGAHLPWFPPLLYATDPSGEALGQIACHDITEGDNPSPVPGVGYQAKVGYDAVSGWGTPNGEALAKAVAGT
jgi:kumamolisin